MASTVWRGYISFGLISIPVRLFRAARPERTSFRRLHRPPENASQSVARQVSQSPEPPASPRELTPVRTRSLLADNDKVVPSEAVVKGFEYEKDRFVVLEPEELKAAAAQTSSAMEIEECVPLSEIDPVYFETSYYVTPEEAGEKAYGLLYRSLQESQLVALAQFAMHGREHVVVLRPGKTGLLAHTMFFENEVRHDEEYGTDLEGISKKELQLAKTLIQSLASAFEPGKYRDTYRERIQELIDRKLKHVPAAVPVTMPKPTNVVDIAEALRQSLSNLKKPAASASKPGVKKSAARHS